MACAPGAAGRGVEGGARSSRCAWPASPSDAACSPSARPRWSGACRAMPRSGPPRPPAAGGWRPRVPRWPGLEALVEQEHARLDGIFESLRHDYQDQVDAVRAGGEKLEQLRQDRHTTEQRLDAVRTRTRTLDLEANEVDLRTEALHRARAPRPRARCPRSWSGCPSPRRPRARRCRSTPRSWSASWSRSAR